MAMEPNLAHSWALSFEHFKAELVFVTGHVKCHVTFSGNILSLRNWWRFLVGIKQKRILHAGQLFLSSQVWNDRSFFRINIL